MGKLQVILYIDDNIDSARMDPHEIVEELLAEHETEVKAGNSMLDIEFVSAEWIEG